MTRKLKSTRKKSTRKGAPATAKKGSSNTQAKKSQEEWEPVTSVAKKAAKGAVKGAAKEMLK